jgi:hypothetical protein
MARPRMCLEVRGDTFWLILGEAVGGEQKGFQHVHLQRQINTFFSWGCSRMSTFPPQAPNVRFLVCVSCRSHQCK